ncbi:MAG: hypothetical protein ACRDWX_05055 [Acidimicrobiia bacterium]
MRLTERFQLLDERSQILGRVGKGWAEACCAERAKDDKQKHGGAQIEVGQVVDP